MALVNVKLEEELEFERAHRDFSHELRGSCFEVDIWPSSSEESDEDLQGAGLMKKRARTFGRPSCLSYADARLGEKHAALARRLHGEPIDAEIDAVAQDEQSQLRQSTSPELGPEFKFGDSLDVM